jgi:hypothetical protein
MRRTAEWLATHAPTWESWAMTRYLSHDPFDYAVEDAAMDKAGKAER